MIQIDIDMPESCSECPIRNHIYGHCPVVANVPKWQREIESLNYKRSEHCPLKEIDE